jgi:Flp pilus assembly protein TadD
MTKGSIKWTVAAVVVLAIGVGAWWGWSRPAADGLIWEAIPPRPLLEGVPAALLRRIEEAEDAAYDGPDRLAGLKELVRLYHANGYLAEARQGYTGLLALEPANPRWAHSLASIQANFGELEEAIAGWETVVRLAPDYLPARVRLGDAYLKRNADAEADAAYRAVLERDTTNAYALVGRGRVAINAQDWEAARAFLMRATAATDDRIGGDLLATVYEELGQTDAAQDLRAREDRMGSYTDQPDPWLEELLPVCYDPFRLAVSGGLAAFAGFPEKGLRWLRQAAELSPDDANIHYQLGHLYLTMGRVEEAQAAFEKTLAVNPGFSDGWLWLSEVMMAKGMPGTAGRILLEGLEHCPDSPGLHLAYGRRLIARGSYEAAIEELRESVRLRPNEASGYNSLAVAYIRSGREAEGVETLRRALAAEPANPFALSTLTMQTIVSGTPDEAAAWLRRCREHPRIQGDALEQLERAYVGRFGGPLPPGG